MNKRDYVVYEQDDMGNGSMCMVKANNLKDLLRNYFYFPYAPDDEEARNKSQADIVYDFEMECGENGNPVMVLDVKSKKVVIGNQ